MLLRVSRGVRPARQHTLLPPFACHLGSPGYAGQTPIRGQPRKSGGPRPRRQVGLEDVGPVVAVRRSWLSRRSASIPAPGRLQRQAEEWTSSCVKKRDQLLSGSHAQGRRCSRLVWKPTGQRARPTLAPAAWVHPPTQDQPEGMSLPPSQAYGLPPCPFSSLPGPQVPAPSGLRSWSPAPGRPLTTWLWPLCWAELPGHRRSVGPSDLTLTPIGTSEGVGEQWPCPETPEPPQMGLRLSTLTRPSGCLHDHPQLWLAVSVNSNGTQVTSPSYRSGFEVSSQEDAIDGAQDLGPRLQDSRAQQSWAGVPCFLRPRRARGIAPLEVGVGQTTIRVSHLLTRWSPDALWVMLGVMRGPECLKRCRAAHLCPAHPAF